MALIPGEDNDDAFNVSMTYLRYCGPASNRRYGPKPAGHHSINHICPACGLMMKEGDYTALIPLGPGDDPEYRKRAREGEFYRAISVEVHWACCSGEETIESESEAEEDND